MPEPLRLVFMGSDDIALPLLDWLAGEGGGVARIVAMVTGPDRPSGRRQAVRPNSVEAWAAGGGARRAASGRLACGRIRAHPARRAHLGPAPRHAQPARLNASQVSRGLAH